MPQVPYQPIPDVSAQATPTPSLRVEASGAAFGTTVASAVEGVGGQLDKVGNELFTRAMAMQDLQNRTQADELYSRFTTEVGLKQGAFDAKQGKDAALGLDPHLKDLSDTRTQYSGYAQNPMVQKLFDSESRGLLARTTLSSASHAGTQNKVWQVKTADATMDANTATVRVDPSNDQAYQDAYDKIPALVATKAGALGMGQEEIAHEIYKQRSVLTGQRIEELSRTDPVRARQMLDDPQTKLEYTDWKRADAQTHTQLVQTGSRVAADKIAQGWDPRMDQAAINRTQGVQEPLLRLVKYVQQQHPELRITVPSMGGTRTPEQQAQLVAQGHSQTLHSSHLDGSGLDLAPVNDKGQIDFNDKQAYDRLDMAMHEASEALGIPLSPEHDKIKGWDPGHYSIPSNLDNAKVPGRPEEPLNSQVDRAVKFARQQFPDDATYADAVEQRVRTQYNMKLQADRDQNFRYSNTIADAIGGYSNTGTPQKLPTTIEELTQDPVVADAWNNAPPTMRNKYTHVLVQNAKQDYTTTEEGFRQFHSISGMAETDPKKFLDTYTPEDIMNLELPRTYRNQLLQVYKAKTKDMTQDPRVTHALQVLGPMLQSANVQRVDKDRYSTFVGTLHDQLQQFQKDNGRAPKDEDITAIGSRLLQEQHIHWWQSSQGTFEIPVPEDEAAKIKADPAWAKQNIVPSDAMIQRVWVAKKYQELYGSAPKASQPNPPGPQVPQSK